MTEDRVGHLLEIDVEALDDPRRRQRFRERREATQVREHDRALERDAAEAEVGVGPREHLLDDGLRHEAREDVAHPLPLERGEQVVGADRSDRGQGQGGGGVDEAQDPPLVEGELAGGEHVGGSEEE